MWMNVTLNITSVPDQEAFLVDATTVTSSGHRWIEAKRQLSSIVASFRPGLLQRSPALDHVAIGIGSLGAVPRSVDQVSGPSQRRGPPRDITRTEFNAYQAPRDSALVSRTYQRTGAAGFQSNLRTVRRRRGHCRLAAAIPY